jgi:hypothetical protein
VVKPGRRAAQIRQIQKINITLSRNLTLTSPHIQAHNTLIPACICNNAYHYRVIAKSHTQMRLPLMLTSPSGTTQQTQTGRRPQKIITCNFTAVSLISFYELFSFGPFCVVVMNTQSKGRAKQLCKDVLISSSCFMASPSWHLRDVQGYFSAPDSV